MQRINLTTRYSRILIRLSMAVVAFVFGHDALMAMSIDDLSPGNSHHIIAVEQCGPEDGLVHGQNVLPFNPADVAIQAREMLGWAASSGALYPFEHAVLDASKLRALLQVYLN